MSTRLSAASVIPDTLEESVDAILGGLALQAVESGRVAEVLPAGQAAVETNVVGQIADVAFDRYRLPGRVKVEHPRATGCRLGQAEQHQDRRGLARAIGPEQAKDLAVLDIQVELVNRGELAVFLVSPRIRMAAVCLKRTASELTLRRPVQRRP